MGDLNDVHYDAFISYRHSELDTFVAEHLMKKLENFKLPKSVRSKVKNGKTRIERVFRDVDELPLVDDLSEPINNALANSDFLIAICTPRYPESEWCMKEIETFLKTHDRDHILVVLAEDEPDRSFPKILTLEEHEEKTKDGKTIIVQREIEPLAADTRGENPKEILKAMEIATVKLAAAMFGMDFDSLRQRHREQKIRRLTLVFGSIGAAVLAFAVFATVMLITISNKNETISGQNESLTKMNEMISEQNLELKDKNETILNQNDELKDKNETILKQNDELKDKNETISKQNEELEERYAGSMVMEADQLLKGGRKKDAVYALRSVLPDSDEGHYNAEVLEKLYSAMNVYCTGKEFSPILNYDTDSTIVDFKISYDNKYILISDLNSVYLYETDTGKLLNKFPFFDEYGRDFEFCGSDAFLLNSEDCVNFISIDGFEEKALEEIIPSYSYYASDDGEITLVFNNEILYGIDREGSIAYRIVLPDRFEDDYMEIDSVSFGNGIASISINGIYNYYFLVIDEKSGEKLLELEGECKMQHRVRSTIKDSYIYFVVTYEELDDYYTSIRAVDYKTNKNIFSQMISGLLSYDITIEGDMIYLNDESRIAVLDARTGKLITSYNTDKSILRVWSDQKCFFVSNDGKVFECSDILYYENTGYFSYAPNQFIMDVKYNNHELFIHFSDTNYLVRYIIQPAEGIMETEAGDLDSLDYRDIVNSDLIPVLGEEKNLLYNAIESDDGKLIAATFTDHTARIYEKGTYRVLNTFLSDAKEYKAVTYSELTGSYILHSNYDSFVLNKDYEIIFKTDRIMGESDGKLIVSDSYHKEFIIPYVDYNGIIAMTDGYLGSYEPDNIIKQKYNIR